MARRRSPRELERRHQTLRMILMAVGIVVLLALFGLGWWMSRERNLARDSRLCPQETGPLSVHVVLIDATDPYNMAQRSQLRSLLLELKDTTPKDGLLAIYVVSEIVAELPVSAFEACSPGDPKDANALIENVTRIRQRWEEQFEKPLRALIDKLLESPALAQSPIMEMVQTVSISTLQKTRVARKLTLVSDLLQNSPLFSLYRSAPRGSRSRQEKAARWYDLFDVFRQSPGFERLRTDLSGVDVELFYIRRDNAEELQGGQLIQLWDRYFSEMNARVSRVKRIEG